MSCCVQVSSRDGLWFLLHVMLVSPDASNQQSKVGAGSKMVIRAGEGLGLQVFPNSVTQVAQVRVPKAAGDFAHIILFWLATNVNRAALQIRSHCHSATMVIVAACHRVTTHSFHRAGAAAVDAKGMDHPEGNLPLLLNSKDSLQVCILQGRQHCKAKLCLL